MRKKLAVAALIAALVLLLSPSAWAGLSDDPDAVEKVLGSVLMLEVYGDDGLIATGSGFVAFNNRTLVTNFHVVKDASYLIAYSDADEPYILKDAKILDEHRDIAILSFFSPTDIKPLSLNRNGVLKRGQRVVAVGSPLGIKNTVAMGNISGVYTDDGVSMIQFTAPISMGSSGGALFDDNGNVIGVTTATMKYGQNLNLAVHIKEVAELYNTWNGTTFSIRGGVSASATVAALPAEVPTLKEIRWKDSKAVAAKYEGTLAPVSDIGIQMYVPNTVVDQKLTQEQLDKNYFLFMSTEGNAFTVVGQILPLSLDLFKAGLDNSGVKAEVTLLNGISCYTFEITTELGKAIGVAFSANGGEKTVSIQMSPVTEETSEMANMMLASIQEVK